MCVPIHLLHLHCCWCVTFPIHQQRLLYLCLAYSLGYGTVVSEATASMSMAVHEVQELSRVTVMCHECVPSLRILQPMRQYLALSGMDMRCCSSVFMLVHIRLLA